MPKLPHMQWQSIMGGMLCIPTEVWQRWKRCDRQRDVTPSVSMGKRIDSIVLGPSKWEGAHGETSLTIQGTLTPEGRATCVKSDCSDWVRSSIATAFSMESINFCRRAKHKARPNWIQCLFWKLITNSPLSTNYRSFRWLHLVRLFASFGQLRNLSLNFEARGETSNNLISLQHFNNLVTSNLIFRVYVCTLK